MEILKTYLPPELTDEEIESGVREIIASTGAQSKKDMGKVMKEATAQLQRAGGREEDSGDRVARYCREAVDSVGSRDRRDDARY